VVNRRARGALLLAGVVLVAACGTDAADQVVDATSSTTAPSVTPAPDDTSASVAEETPGGTAAPGGTVGAPDSRPADPGAPPPPPPPDTGAASDTPAVAPAGRVGSLATRYLRPAESERVLIQVLVQDGAAPRPAVPERIRHVLGQVSGKPVSVATGGLGGGARSWTSEELRGLADSSSPPQTAEQAVLTLLFLRGGFADNDRAVGVAVRGDVAAVFAERVDEAAGTLGNRSAVEDAVTMHEVGHLLGLVDLVLDTGRQDPEHPGHSPNRDSVMYYAVESTLLGSVLSGGPPRDFDQADLDDLARIRNG
jgi:hypothetical protein